MEYYGTLGPACGSVQTLKEMLAAGMTGVRLNLSHGDLEENGHWIRMVQEAGRELHSQVQILMDLRGPELRLGRFREEIQAEEGSWPGPWRWRPSGSGGSTGICVSGRPDPH